MAGEFLYFIIYVLQQLGVMLAVGAQTVLLCAHLVAIHRGEQDNPHTGYARATRSALGVGLFLIIVSGLGAVAVHTLNGQVAVLLAPAFLFKWLLIVILLAAFFVQNHARSWSNVYYAFSGATWYALFLVHSLGPVTSWTTLFVLYGLWLVFFSALWPVFVAVMRWHSAAPAPTAYIAAPKKSVPASVPPAPKPIPPPSPPPKPIPAPPPPPLPKPVPPPAPKPMPPTALTPVLPPVQKPISPPAPVPVSVPVVAIVSPAVKKKPWWQRLFSWFPRRTPKTLALPVPVPPPAPAPAPVSPPPVTKPAPVVVSVPAPVPTAPRLKVVALPPLMPEPPKPVPLPVTPPPAAAPTFAAAPKSALKDIIDHLLVPALRIMPQTPEDIGKQNRAPVIKPDA